MTTNRSDQTGSQAISYDQLQSDIDAIKAKLMAKRDNQSTADYQTRLNYLVLAFEVIGRTAIFCWPITPFIWFFGVISLALSKIIENMELGHNAMHGQFRPLNETPPSAPPYYEWKTVTPAYSWHTGHNINHHRNVGIVGKDNDIEGLRVSDKQTWKPIHLLQPLLVLLSALFYQWAIALHNLGINAWRNGDKSDENFKAETKQLAKKSAWHMTKEYVLFPVLAGPNFLTVIAGNLLANGIRNIWAWSVIICNHCTDNIELFDLSASAHESRGQYYYRQIRASANFSGSRALHFLSGHLGIHIEHHLMPTLPSYLLPEAQREIEACCNKHGIPYNNKPFIIQLGHAIRRIVRYSIP